MTTNQSTSESPEPQGITPIPQIVADALELCAYDGDVEAAAEYVHALIDGFESKGPDRHRDAAALRLEADRLLNEARDRQLMADLRAAERWAAKRAPMSEPVMVCRPEVGDFVLGWDGALWRIDEIDPDCVGCGADASYSHQGDLYMWRLTDPIPERADPDQTPPDRQRLPADAVPGWVWLDEGGRETGERYRASTPPPVDPRGWAWVSLC
jgi:hypothetical protein